MKPSSRVGPHDNSEPTLNAKLASQSSHIRTSSNVRTDEIDERYRVFVQDRVDYPIEGTISMIHPVDYRSQSSSLAVTTSVTPWIYHPNFLSPPVYPSDKKRQQGKRRNLSQATENTDIEQVYHIVKEGYSNITLISNTAPPR